MVVSPDGAYAYVANGGSHTVSVVRLAAPPAAPTDLTAASGHGEVTIGWTAPSGGPPVLGYLVEYRESPAGAWTAAPGPGTSTTATVTGLAAGSLYDFRVTATNAAGAGVPSDPVTAGPLDPVLTLDATTLLPGASFTATVTGLLPGTEYGIAVHSDPVLLTTFTTSTGGGATTTATIPADTTPGPHTLVVHLGGDIAGAAVASSLVTIAAPAGPVPPAPAGLAVSGVDAASWVGWILVALVSLLAGAVLVLRARTRRIGG